MSAILFSSIYENGVWNHNQPHVPKSGPGSTLSSTTNIRNFLDSFTSENPGLTLVDLGCGDLTWMSTTESFKRSNYIGIDIVAKLIEDHTQKYANSTTRFECLDIVRDDLPDGDIVIVRDVLFHLSHEAIAILLKKVQKYKYALLTSCRNTFNSTDFDACHFHKVNLHASPFFFRQGLTKIDETKFDRDVEFYDFSTDSLYEQWDSNSQIVLHELNESLQKHLIQKQEKPLLLGNLAQDHLEPQFWLKRANPVNEAKRKRLVKLASLVSKAFEIGLNGGHSALLFLTANPKLELTCNDIAQFYALEPLCLPHEQVPIAAQFLSRKFSRFSYIQGDCTRVIPQFVQSREEQSFDCLHLDGAKQTQETDFFNFLPLLKKNAYVAFDDTNQPAVQALVDRLVAQGLVKRTAEFLPMSQSERQRNEIVQVV